VLETAIKQALGHDSSRWSPGAPSRLQAQWKPAQQKRAECYDLPASQPG